MNTMSKTDKKVIAPSQYFEQLKELKNSMTEKGLDDLYENCLVLLNEYQRSGQLAAQKKLLFHLETIIKERQLVELGVDTFVYKSDIDEYMHIVDGRVVKIIELENYQRRIPEEIIQVIEKCRGIFDQMYILFTDYTGKEERKIKAEHREKDPILFGTFQDRTTRTVVERFYFLGDWIDEQCDLTLDKMVAEMKSKTNKDIEMKFRTPEDVAELRKQLENLDETMNGLYRQVNKEPSKKEPFFKRIFAVIRGH